MDDTPEMIRQQMDGTKAQLSEKLESLELQVSQTVRSTGTAVNATVGAVQETVETVTGAVQDAVRSVSSALDMRSHIENHPWLVFGGSVVVGYLAVEYLSRPAKQPSPSPRQLRGNAGQETGRTTAVNSVAGEPGAMNSFWHQLRGVAVGALVGIVQDVTARAVPHVMDYLTNHKASNAKSPALGAGEQGGAPRRHESSETVQRGFIAPSENGGSIREPVGSK